MKEQRDKTRTRLLQKLKKALAVNRFGTYDSGSDINRAELAFPPPDPRSLISDPRTQPGDNEPLGTFKFNLIPLLEEEITKTGGVLHLARNGAEVAQYLLNLAKRINAKTIIREDSHILDNLKLDQSLTDEGFLVIIDNFGDEEASKAAWRQQAKEASLGITSIDYILADTATVVIKSRPGRSRILSLVPPIHVAIGEEQQVLPQLEDLFRQETTLKSSSAFIFITGPSRTADIEQTLTIGVHGPIEFHLILLAHG